MNHKSRIVAGLFLFLMLMAGKGAMAGAGTECCNLIGACSELTDQQILDAALMPPGGGATALGMCYYHERCTGCAQDFYVKLSNLPAPSGYDGGTGGLPFGSTPADVVKVLRNLCEAGACCCPQKTASSSCPTLGTAVWAKDPITKSCCQYSNACLAPSGWPKFATKDECYGIG
jgi:hypothetical protein